MSEPYHLSVYLPEALLTRLRAVSAESSVPMAALVRRGLERELAARQPTPAGAPPESPQP